MSSLEKAVQTQLDNIQKEPGKSLDELAAIFQKSGLTKHEPGLGHGDAQEVDSELVAWIKSAYEGAG